MDATAIVVAIIVGAPATFAAWNQRNAQRDARLAREAAERAELVTIETKRASLAAAESQRRATEEVHTIVNSQRTEAAAAIEALKGEIRRLKADPTATTPAAGGSVNLADDTGVVTTPNTHRRRHDDPTGIDVRAGEKP